MVNEAHVLAQGSAQADLEFLVGRTHLTCCMTVGASEIQEGKLDMHD